MLGRRQDADVGPGPSLKSDDDRRHLDGFRAGPHREEDLSCLLWPQNAIRFPVGFAGRGRLGEDPPSGPGREQAIYVSRHLAP